TTKATGEYKWSEADRGRDAEERQRDPLDELARAQLLQHLGIDARVLERRLLGARTQTVEADVDRERHLHLDGRRPEGIVLRQRVRLAVGEHAEVHAPEPQPGAVLELGERVLDVRPRGRAAAHQPR